MSTSLYLITDSKLTGRETDLDWNRILNQLKDLNMSTTSFVDAKNEVIKEEGNWEFLVEKDDGHLLNIEFEGPFHMQPTLYSNIGLISTIYNYSFLYNIYRYDWFHSFRQDLYDIVKIIGGTEGIYLADGPCRKLAEFLEEMVLENIPYEDIKREMIKELGSPVTDYSQLDDNKLDYYKIDEFVFDDFNDLKNEQQ